MLILIIQTIILALVMLFFSITEIYFAFIVSILLGLVTLFYFKKFDKKQVLKINILSSLIVAFIIALVYFIFLARINAMININASNILFNYTKLFNINNFLIRTFGSLVLFNIPSIIYFFLGKKE